MPPKLIFKTLQFQCHLQCGQCDHLTVAGVQCKRRVCFGAPTCWQHSKQDYGIKIKESTLEGTGKGLFATRYIPMGAWICPYLGEELQQACLDLRYPGNMTAPYTETDTAPDGTVTIVDSACYRGIGSMSNGLFNQRTGVIRAKESHNSETVYRDEYSQIWLRATRNIPEGREVFVYYGADYHLEPHETKRRNGNDTRPC